MRLRDIELGNVFNASGARGFFGEGYEYHSPWKVLGLRYEGSTLITKTTTLLPRAGNMPLRPDFSPVERIPKCIVVKPWAGAVLNSVGLSGPGFHALSREWLGRKSGQHMMVSFMAVSAETQGRIQETRNFAEAFRLFAYQYGTHNLSLQVNMSCPNTGHDVGGDEVANEVLKVLDILGPIGVPLLVKVNALFPVKPLVTVTQSHPYCDGLVVSNTIPWGKLPEKIDWEGLFGSKTSPLAHLGGGGLSGKPLLHIVADWIRWARSHGFSKPIVGGGGILSKKDADLFLDVGASAVELGSVSILRPWRVAGIIEHVNRRLA